MSDGRLKHSRAHAGGAAAARVNQRYYLRRIVDHDGEKEVLECGHSIYPKHDMIGQTYAERRRCPFCPKPECPDCDGRGFAIYYRDGNVIPYRGDECAECKGRGVL
jgi:hypothetical protein